VGSIEGRCGVQAYDVNKSVQDSTLNFCFKCHRKEETVPTVRPRYGH